MVEIQTRFITEHLVPGQRLGRHVGWDPRSKDFPYEGAGVATLASLRRKRRIGPFNQGNLGSCTGNSSSGATATAPFKNPLKATARSQKVPLQVYEAATRLDSFPGEYLPTDTGSTGLAAAKALHNLGAVSSYKHALNLAAAVQAAADPTVGLIFGIDWYDSFDSPDSSGLIGIGKGAQVRGGHEIECDGIELATPGTYSGSDLVWFWQSWGAWGYEGKGQFCMTVDTLGTLLNKENQGDCTILVP